MDTLCPRKLVSVLGVAATLSLFTILFANESFSNFVSELVGHDSNPTLGSRGQVPFGLESSQSENGNGSTSTSDTAMSATCDPEKCALEVQSVLPPRHAQAQIAAHVTIAMYWPEEKGGGWWPWDHPSTMNGLVDAAHSSGCVASSSSCSFVDHTQVASADAVIFHTWHMNQGWGPSDLQLKLGVKPPNQKWVLLTLESDSNYPMQRSSGVLSHIDWLMTYDKDAEIQSTYANRLWHRSVFATHSEKRSDASAVFISSNCGPKNARLSTVQGLKQYLHIDSYGACEHNKDFEQDDQGQDSSAKLNMMGSYKFCLAFENTDQQDYVSEKFFHALSAGCVPVYMGAPNAKEYAPVEKSVIFTSDFATVDELGEFLRNLLENESEYQEYLKWKENPSKETIERMANLRFLSFPTSPCRLCEKLQGFEIQRQFCEKNAMAESTVTYLMDTQPYRQYHDHAGGKPLSEMIGDDKCGTV